MAFKDESSRWNEHINKLKEVKEKRQQGIDIDAGELEPPKTEREAKNETIRIKSGEGLENNPFVRKISLEELINALRAERGEKPLSREKRTPFIKRDKEINALAMDKSKGAAHR